MPLLMASNMFSLWRKC